MAKIIYFQLGERERIEVYQLLLSLRNILGVLEDLDASISHKKTGTVRWEVAVLRKCSPPLIGIEGLPASRKIPGHAHHVQREVLDGLGDLMKTPERRPYYSDSVLEKISKLAVQSKTLGPFKVYTNGTEHKKEVIIGESTYKNIEQLIGVKYKALGSVVGNLEALNLHRRYEFRIWNETTGKPITCFFSHDMLQKVKDSIKGRVLVYGEINFNQRGEPVSMLVDDIIPKRSQTDLPTIEEMSGLVKDMYEGKTLKGYLEDIKND